jgi:hypothetical protein
MGGEIDAIMAPIVRHCSIYLPGWIADDQLRRRFPRSVQVWYAPLSVYFSMDRGHPGDSRGGRPTTQRWIAERLLGLADRLFGNDQVGSEPPRRWWVRYLVVSALAATIIFVRRIDSVTNPQFFRR